MKTWLASIAAVAALGFAMFSAVPAHATVNNTCGSLKVSLGTASGAAGSTYRPVKFTNTGAKSCKIFGFPGVSLTRANHSQIGLSAARDRSVPEPHLTLLPGHTASAVLRIVNAGNYPVSVCAPVTSSFLKVYPPDSTSPRFISLHVKTCSKPVRTLFIRPVR